MVNVKGERLDMCAFCVMPAVAPCITYLRLSWKISYMSQLISPMAEMRPFFRGRSRVSLRTGDREYDRILAFTGLHRADCDHVVAISDQESFSSLVC